MAFSRIMKQFGRANTHSIASHFSAQLHTPEIFFTMAATTAIRYYTRTLLLCIGIIFVLSSSLRLNPPLEDLSSEKKVILEQAAATNTSNTPSPQRPQSHIRRRRRGRPTIALGKKRTHSSHHCMGPRDMLPLYKSCHFTDVCFDSKGTMLYFHDEQDGKAPTAEELKTAVRIQSARQCPRIGCERPEDSYLIPKVVPANDFENYQKVWSPIPFAIPYTVFNGQNFGHSIGDNVFSFYRLLKLFGVYSDTVDFLPLRVHDCDASGKCMKDGIAPRVLTKVLDPFVLNTKQSLNQPGTVGNGEFHTYYRNTMPQQADENSVVCFQNVLSGRYLLADHGEDENFHGHKPELGTNSYFVAKGDLLLDFRNDYMQRLGVGEDFDLHYHCQECPTPSDENKVMGTDVLIIPRPENSFGGGWNEDLLLTLMKEGCLGEGRTFRVLDARQMTMVEQVQAAASAKVMISMVGGASLLSWFLPPGGTSILLQRGGKTLDSHVFDNLAYLNTHVTAHTESSNGPKGEKFPNFKFDYNDMCRQAKRGIEQYEASLRNTPSPCGSETCTISD